ncbi:response regulator transcription factor [Fusibacter ferrireducens]|uniref:Stage 0 sporulation protein A homolog n=1 Tax=Fusibacter ferrireducens TaxID=2785058 RepID=A0ABR9ZQI0_9FIRM|nr:response regulator transcription factor [Fusibacter ferrireducens]MBF4692717.1 response regulator transcription factor [Fusibacter ferrireducens]
MKNILLIEDDIEIGEVEKAYLEISGFRVVVEKNGLKGKEAALKEPFDMVVLDIMLPGLDGFKIAEAIRSYKDIPIMIVSAKNTEVDKLKGLSLGIDDYLTKPFSPHELVARVKAHLKRYEMLKNGTNGVAHKRFELRGILIDFETRQVFVNGELVELTVKEYDLLVLLASVPNKVFSKDEIFAKVWGYEVEIDTSTLTVHVRKLREKIEFDPSNPEYIQTVWGVGYKLKK